MADLNAQQPNNKPLDVSALGGINIDPAKMGKFGSAIMGTFANADKQRAEAKADYQTTVAPLQAQEKSAFKEQQDIGVKQETAAKEYADLTKEEANWMEKNYPKNEPLPEFKPEKINQQELNGVASMVMAFAVLGGKHSLNKGAAMGNALAGAIDGYTKGNQIKFETQYKAFKTNFDSLVRTREEELKRYQNLLNSKEKGMQSKKAELEILAMAHGNAKDRQAFARGSIEQAHKYLEDNYREIESHSDKIIKGVEFMQREEDKLIAHRDSMEMKKLMLALQGQKTGGGEAGARAFIRDTTGKTITDDKEAQAIQQGVLGLTSTDRLLNKLKDPEIRTGMPLILTKYQEMLRDSNLDPNAELSDAQVNDLINKAGSAAVNDPQGRKIGKNIVMLKEALFTAYQAERAAGGNKLTVQMMRQAGPALDPKNYQKEDYISILGGRRTDIVNLLHGFNINNDDIRTMSDQITQEKAFASTSNVALPAGIPPGATKIGTSKPDKNGKVHDVYQLNGVNYIPDEEK